MSGISILSTNPGLEAAFVSIYRRNHSVRRVWSDQWRDPAEIAMDACAADPDVLIIGSDLNRETVKILIPEIDRRFPATTILVLVPAPDVSYSIDVLRLGARDVLVESPTSEEFRVEFDRILDLASSRRQRTSDMARAPRRRVISVLSPKGGTGKTTLASNLAVGLAQRMPNQVLLLDLDVQFGDCAAALGLQPEYSLAQAMAASTNERSAMKVFLTPHQSGLLLLPPPDDLVAAEEMDSGLLKRTISALTEEFPFVIVDTASGIDAAALAAMELSTDFLFISTTDVPSIRALRRQIEALDQIGFVSQRRSFVLNRSNAKVGLSVSDVEAAVGLKATFQIPSTRLIPVSTNEGVPAIQKDAGGTAAKFKEIADFFAPDDGDSNRSFLRSLRKDR